MAARKLRKKSADALRSIGEAAKQLGLQAHVLRYWETKFPKQVKPIKRSDGRRLFRPEDMSALRAIQILVHERGMTLKGAKALLGEQGVEAVLSGDARLVAIAPAAAVEARVEDSVKAPVSVPSPARDLQKAVGAAFGADMALEDSKATGSTEGLQNVLVEMTDIKRRLDALRAQRAA